VSHKAQRNDPCPCGSGKKFKKCCMLEERNLSAVRAANREVVQEAVNWITQKHGDALINWMEKVWFDGCDEQMRKGIATADPAIKHIHDTNLLEYLIAEGALQEANEAGEDAGEASGDGVETEEKPALQLILDAVAHLTDAQRDYLQQLATNPLRLYLVTDCRPGEGFSLLRHPPVDKGDAVCIEDKWISRMLDDGDTVGLRLMQTGGVWETSGAVYHIPEEYVAELAGKLSEANDEDYSRNLILFWLGLVAAHV